MNQQCNVNMDCAWAWCYAYDILHNYNVVIVNVNLKCKYNLTELIGMTIFTEINSATFCVLSKLLFRPSSSYQQRSCEALVTCTSAAVAMYSSLVFRNVSGMQSRVTISYQVSKWIRGNKYGLVPFNYYDQLLTVRWGFDSNWNFDCHVTRILGLSQRSMF